MTSDPMAVVERALRRRRPLRPPRPRRAPGRPPASGCCDGRTRVLVVGEFKQGKSLLVNGLVGAPVCPTFDDVATAVPTVVRHAETPWTIVARCRPDGDAGRDPGATSSPTTSASRATPATARAGATPRSGSRGPCWPAGWRSSTPPASAGCRRCTARRRRPRCRRRTRCCSSPTPRRSTPAPELEFLAHAASVCPNVACVITKTDLLPAVAAHRRAGPGPPRRRRDQRPSIFAVSSTLRWHAVLHERRRGQRRVRLPRAGRVPAQAGARAGRPAGPARRGARRPRRHRADRGQPARRSAPRSRTRPPSPR